ncbi:flavin reductase family protein [Actinomadura soli]|uniref:Flavin reductase family protein n=1 Tax=Actinomadura soli TaxID=2508997 RepID=A0A5C4JJM6_9ACTN|nr:flavin reductase family protein [Actinomadura soli]
MRTAHPPTGRPSCCPLTTTPCATSGTPSGCAAREATTWTSAWADCTVHAVHDGGDHHIVIGRVDDLTAGTGERPLLFYRGGYTVTEPPSAPAHAQPHFLTWADPGEWY